MTLARFGVPFHAVVCQNTYPQLYVLVHLRLTEFNDTSRSKFFLSLYHFYSFSFLYHYFFFFFSFIFSTQIIGNLVLSSNHNSMPPVGHNSVLSPYAQNLTHSWTAFVGICCTLVTRERREKISHPSITTHLRSFVVNFPQKTIFVEWIKFNVP